MQEEFIELLRDGLSHLYDADHLRQSPLATLLGVANRSDTASTLRSILIEGVESLKPKDDTPSRSRDWRLYDSLFYYYVQQLSQGIVADQLALSVRHLRREQRAAVQVLANLLWGQIEPGAQLCGGAGADIPRAQTATNSPNVSEELGWLKDLPSEKPTNLKSILSEVLDLAQPLLTQHGVHTEITIDDDLPALAVHPVALDQILLSLLSVAIPRSAGGRVQISVSALYWEVEIQVQGKGSPSGLQPILDNDADSLEVSRQLVDLCGGRLTLHREEKEALSATLILPALEQLPVLAIDDNADTLQLLQRYTAGTRYRLVGIQDPDRALEMAEKVSPRIIVLDVMMPQVDGWRVMATLRQHPLTSHIPIVVCTILAQEKLALTLGASDFIQKPATRQTLLDALNRQAELIKP